MNVLVVTTSYPRDARDAAGSFVAARVAALRARGERVRVVAAGEGRGEVDLVRVPFSIAGAPPLFYGEGAPERLEAGPAAWLAALRFSAGLVAAVRAELAARPDRVETHWLVPSALAVLAAGYRGPHRAHAHSGDVALLERIPGGPSLARWMAGRADTLVFASADLRTRWARLTGALTGEVSAAESVLVRGPAVRRPPQERARLRRARGIAGALVLGVGRLVPIKGYDRLVRAVGRLPAMGRPEVVLLGEGGERAALARLAADRGVALVMPGQVPPDEVAAWLALADVFVHPARRLPSGRTEGTPVAVREALAAGLPVIASATGGVPELEPSWHEQLTLLPAEDGSAAVAALSSAIAGTLRKHSREIASSAQENGH